MTTKSHDTAEGEETRDPKGRFVKGGKPGPGRSRGARSRLGEQFLEALAADFSIHGEGVIEKVRSKDPSTYLKLIGNVLPREVITAAFSVSATGIADIEDARTFLQAYRMVRDAPVIEAEPLPVPEGVLVTDSWRADDD
jgi:hypothetical protein